MFLAFVPGMRSWNSAVRNILLFLALMKTNVYGSKSTAYGGIYREHAKHLLTFRSSKDPKNDRFAFNENSLITFKSFMHITIKSFE